MERKVLDLRRTRWLGPAAIAGRLGMHASTVYRVLRRYGHANTGSHRPGRRAARPQTAPRAATNTPRPATWCTPTSGNSAASPTAADGAPSAA